MDKKRSVRVSRLLARILRHAPEEFGLVLTEGGWVGVNDLLEALDFHGMRLSRPELGEVVARNDKQRFAFDETGSMIRASQGHSVPVVLDLPRAVPPAALFHGTVADALPAIRREGLRAMARHHVHLSATVETATRVGSRRGTPVVLRINTAHMVTDGHEFFLSANGVWLVDKVPPQYMTC